MAIFIGCPSYHIVWLPFCVCLAHFPFVTWMGFLLHISWFSSVTKGPTYGSHHLYLLIKIGGNYTLFITSSWQSLSSAAELDKVEITTLGQMCGLSNPFVNSPIGNGECENVCYLFSICPPPPNLFLPRCVWGGWPLWITSAGLLCFTFWFQWVWPVGDTSRRYKNKEEREVGVLIPLISGNGFFSICSPSPSTGESLGSRNSCSLPFPF